MDKKQKFKTADQHELRGMVRRSRPKVSWEQLPISSSTAAQLRAATIASKNSKYATCLFTGIGGTGKTLAAEVLASELGKELLQVDLAAIASKYIGETEKNLERVFTAAEQADAVLLFDEADALFGKRTEIKDSHDRYANTETNYLLQRIETFPGLVILATNIKQDIDAAFLRRFRYVVDFPKVEPGS